MDWDAGRGETGQSATVCDGKGHIVICINPKAIDIKTGPNNPYSPDPNAPGPKRDPLQRCILEGERAGAAATVAACGDNACKKSDGTLIPAGRISFDNCSGDPACTKLDIELAVQRKIASCARGVQMSAKAHPDDLYNDDLRLQAERMESQANTNITKFETAKKDRGCK